MTKTMRKISDDNLKKSLLADIRAHGLLKTGETVLAAVSGGPDSVFLLYLLLSMKNELGIEVRAAHLNHGLRGREADADAAFVRMLAGKLGVPVTIKKLDVKAISRKKKQSIETAAREARREFLQATARKHRCGKIATGHTRDDQAETVLMHLVRGSGLAGLAGIPRVNGPFIRPLLGIGRADLLAYLDRNKLAYRMDRTNQDLEFTRNRIRHRLLPVLREFNPRISYALAGLSQIVRSDLDLIREATLQAFKASSRADSAQISIDLSKFKRYNNGLQNHLIRYSVERLAGPGKVPDHFSASQAVRLIDRGKTGARCQLLGDIWLEKSYNQAVIVSSPPAGENPAPPSVAAHPVPLPVPGKIRFGRFIIKAGLVKKNSVPRAELQQNERAYFDRERLPSKRISVGTRRPGETMVPFGARTAKKIKELMIDAKIPAQRRAGWPVVRSGRDVIWIPGVRRSGAAPVTAQTKTLLLLEYHTRT